MKNIQYKFEYTRYESLEELDHERKNLVVAAQEIANQAYAPYSNFHVGAAVLLENGEILKGNNQENASYPVGICAERTLLSFVHANHPEKKMLKLAISVPDTDFDVSPCGMCRQFILEFEKKQAQPIEIILHNRTGSVLVIPSISVLLPLHFESKMLS